MSSSASTSACRSTSASRRTRGCRLHGRMPLRPARRRRARRHSTAGQVGDRSRAVGVRCRHERRRERGRRGDDCLASALAQASPVLVHTAGGAAHDGGSGVDRGDGGGGDGGGASAGVADDEPSQRRFEEFARALCPSSGCCPGPSLLREYLIRLAASPDDPRAAALRARPRAHCAAARGTAAAAAAPLHRRGAPLCVRMPAARRRRARADDPAVQGAAHT